MSYELNAGFLLINKPSGISSYDCIAYLRKIIGKKTKVGHAGTLDPFASGLLIVAIGRQATRLMPQLMKLDKTYIAYVKLGELTETLDYTGKVLLHNNIVNVTENELFQAIESMGSFYEQIPPFYSALKHEGQPLYKLARNKRLSVEELCAITTSKKKVVQLHNLSLISYEKPFFTIKAHVSHGTYIRSLVDDIAKKMNMRATTYGLQRLSIGTFLLKDATILTNIKNIQDVADKLISIDDIDSFL